jgi:hypothetical protein
MKESQVTFRLSSKMQDRLKQEMERLGLLTEDELMRFIVVTYFEAVNMTA